MTESGKHEYNRRRREFAQKPVEDLIDLLSSDELGIRFVAEMALRDRTGT